MYNHFNPQAKEEYWRSRPYLDFISRRPCVRCGAMNPENADGERRNDPHHERALGGGGTAIKPSDSHAVSLCHDCHLLRDRFRGPVFPHIEDWEESFYPEHVDVKMEIVNSLTQFIVEKRYGMQKK